MSHIDQEPEEGQPVDVSFLKNTDNPTPQDRITILRRIVKNQTAEVVEGSVVDLFTASMLVQVYDALSEANRAKFVSLPVQKMAILGWKLVA